MILIDCHGPTSGLRVEFGGRDDVEIWAWVELSEPDENGSLQPTIRYARIGLGQCLELATASGSHRSSMSDRVIAGMTAYLANHHADDELDAPGRPCDHFGFYWGLPGRPHGLTRREHARLLTCAACGGPPTHNRGEGAAWGTP